MFTQHFNSVKTKFSLIVVRKLKKTDEKAINEVIERLKKYPNAKYELNEDSIIVKEITRMDFQFR